MTEHTFPIPSGGLNGDQLAAELGELSLNVRVVDDLLVVVTDNPDVEAIVAAHVPATVVPPLTIEEKLAELPDPTVDFDGFKAKLAEILT